MNVVGLARCMLLVVAFTHGTAASSVSVDEDSFAQIVWSAIRDSESIRRTVAEENQVTDDPIGETPQTLRALFMRSFPYVVIYGNESRSINVPDDTRLVSTTIDGHIGTFVRVQTRTFTYTSRLPHLRAGESHPTFFDYHALGGSSISWGDVAREAETHGLSDAQQHIDRILHDWHRMPCEELFLLITGVNEADLSCNEQAREHQMESVMRAYVGSVWMDDRGPWPTARVFNVSRAGSRIYVVPSTDRGWEKGADTPSRLHHVYGFCQTTAALESVGTFQLDEYASDDRTAAWIIHELLMDRPDKDNEPKGD